MPELVTLSFPSKGGAEDCLRDLLPLEQEHLIKLTDLAWGAKNDNGKISSWHLHPTALEALIRGSLWGTFAGAMLLEPFFGMLIGGATALFMTSLRSNEGLINRAHVDNMLRRVLEPGQSALFLMIERATPDKLMARLHSHPATIVSTSLSEAEEKRLRDAWKRIRRDGKYGLRTRASSETQRLPGTPASL